MNVRKKKSVTPEDARRAYQRKQTDPGKFIYDEDGFIYPFKDGVRKIKWSSIERLEGYKQDMMTYDDICMDITFDGLGVVFSEDVPGWYVFQAKLREVLPKVPATWEFDVMFPAFATNYTLLYEREDRVMPAASNFHSSFKSIERAEMQRVLEKHGWNKRKESSVCTMSTNTWTELYLEGSKSGLRLHGLVAYHPNNIRLLNEVFDGLGVFYRYEFYDEKGILLLERRSDEKEK